MVLLRRLAAGLAASLFVAPCDVGATVIAGGNIVNQTWTAAGSPYIVQGDITVPAGAFLDIQAGVVVQMAATDSQAAGLDTSKVEITVKGALTVSPTAQFVSQAGSAASPWYGIVIDALATTSTVAGTIKHAIRGVTVNSASAGVTISDLALADLAKTSQNACGIVYATGSSGAPARITASNVLSAICVYQAGVTVSDVQVTGATSCAIVVNGGPNTIDRVRVSASLAGVCVRDYGTVTIRNALLTGNYYGVFGQVTPPFPIAADPTVESKIHGNEDGAKSAYLIATYHIVNATIHGNQYGVSLAFPGVTVDVVNSIVTANTGFGVDTPPSSPILNCNVFGNGVDYSGLAVAGAGTISADPHYVDAVAGNFHLLPASPSVDTGTTAAYGSLDLDGNPRVFGPGVDMGAYEVQVRPEDADSDGDSIPDSVEGVEGRNAFVKDNDIFGNARLFAMQQYRDFLGREGDPGGITAWAGLVTAGTYTRNQVIDAFLSSQEFTGSMAPVVRLYFATFLRVPDYAGMTVNAGLLRNGTVTLAQMAEFFTTSPEFAATYGALDNAGFVALLYNNVLNRAPDSGGLAAWVSLLQGGMTRGQVLLGFSDSTEFQAATASEVFVTMMYAGMLRRTPEQAGFSAWVSLLDAGTLTRERVINGFFLSTEYHDRFLP